MDQLHIIHTHDSCMSITSVEHGISLIYKERLDNPKELHLHCGSDLIPTASRVIKDINDAQDEYKIKLVLDDYLKVDAYFLTDGVFLIYSNPD